MNSNQTVTNQLNGDNGDRKRTAFSFFFFKLVCYTSSSIHTHIHTSVGEKNHKMAIFCLMLCKPHKSTKNKGKQLYTISYTQKRHSCSANLSQFFVLLSQRANGSMTALISYLSKRCATRPLHGWGVWAWEERHGVLH